MNDNWYIDYIKIRSRAPFWSDVTHTSLKDQVTVFNQDLDVWDKMNVLVIFKGAPILYSPADKLIFE